MHSLLAFISIDNCGKKVSSMFGGEFCTGGLRRRWRMGGLHEVLRSSGWWKVTLSGADLFS